MISSVTLNFKIQTEATDRLVEFLTSLLVLALSDWDDSFHIQTDAGETGAGAILLKFRQSLRES